MGASLKTRRFDTNRPPPAAPLSARFRVATKKPFWMMTLLTCFFLTFLRLRELSLFTFAHFFSPPFWQRNLRHFSPASRAVSTRPMATRPPSDERSAVRLRVPTAVAARRERLGAENCFQIPAQTATPKNFHSDRIDDMTFSECVCYFSPLLSLPHPQTGEKFTTPSTRQRDRFGAAASQLSEQFTTARTVGKS